MLLWASASLRAVLLWGGIGFVKVELLSEKQIPGAIAAAEVVDLSIVLEEDAGGEVAAHADLAVGDDGAIVGNFVQT